ncbi:outer membrane autotransporter [Coniochaeta sp. 2T2.1]|nr:outer membrane autotransporter [Coniochaeta sp. 2T2.1]
MAIRTLAAGLVAALATSCLAAPSTTTATAQTPVFSTSCNGKPYVYNELAGYGFVPGNAVDKYGDTISFGSSITIKDWTKKNGVYSGTLYGLPDRGWNTNGTNGFVSRVHKFGVTLTDTTGGSAEEPLAQNLKFTYQDTILFTDPSGAYTSGLDPDQSGGLQFDGFPILPAATYPGDAFGGAGAGGKRVSIDAEGLVVDKDGSFWVSDEYGPYVYRFSPTGKMTLAIAPPDAILPLRQGYVSFPSDNPPMYNPDQHPTPTNPTQGRQNNQGFEGLTISTDGKKLYTILQSAARQEGGSSSSTRYYTRLLQYALGGDSPTPVYEAEYVVPLPTFTNAAGQKRVAAQSELHYAGGTQFFFLPRDSNVGQTFADTQSMYRHVDVFDIAGATNVAGAKYDAFNASIASSAGVLNVDITPATVCPFLDMNVNAQLNRFGLHNGGEQDAGLLNEKWEGIALVPATSANCKTGPEYFMFVASDNDFITQDGRSFFSLRWW